MTKAKLTEHLRHSQFRLARLAELDERIRQNDYADDLQTRHYRTQKVTLDKHHGIDSSAPIRLTKKSETRKTKRLEQARLRTSIDLDAFEKQLREIKPEEHTIDYLTELKRRRDRKAIDNRRRRKRLEKIICDHDQVGSNSRNNCCS